MRIRKCFVLSYPPSQQYLSDLNLHQPSDQSMAMGGLNHPMFSPGKDCTREKRMTQKEFGDDETWRSYDETSNDIREILRIADHSGESHDHNILDQPFSSSSSAQGGEHHENEIVPLKKKRKGSLERHQKESSAKILKSKTNKKCDSTSVSDDMIKVESAPANYINGREDGTSLILQCPKMIINNSDGKCCSKKKIKSNNRGKVMKEGWRCSRVNGRGWRCCQPTMVGYSLCEHHLGKGRLRQPPAADHVAATKKMMRTKVGVVKARSIATLLNLNIH